MVRVNVKSSTMLTVGYDQSTMVFEVEFKNGTVYQYQSVPASVFDGFMGSGSKGKFLYAEIRGKYVHKKVFDPKDEEE